MFPLSFFLSCAPSSFVCKATREPATRALLGLPEGGGLRRMARCLRGGRGWIGATEANVTMDCTIKFFDCPSVAGLVAEDDVAAPAAGRQASRLSRRVVAPRPLR